jgi:hypothetical protein
MYATAALMVKGATVFRNTGCDGKTDLCFKYEGQVYEIDVKLARLVESTNGRLYWRSTTAREVLKPTYALIVVPRTGTDLSGWYCKWYYSNGGGKRVYGGPPGLENFWN